MRFYELVKACCREMSKCGGYMVIKGNKIVCADEQCGYVTDRKMLKKDSE